MNPVLLICLPSGVDRFRFLYYGIDFDGHETGNIQFLMMIRKKSSELHELLVKSILLINELSIMEYQLAHLPSPSYCMYV